MHCHAAYVSLHYHGKASQLMDTCRLVNRSGLRLSYWTDDVGEDGEMGCAYTLNAWEESPLLVDPVERTVIIPDTQQQVTAMQHGMHVACRSHVRTVRTHDSQASLLDMPCRT